jgi:hypothetical protein
MKFTRIIFITAFATMARCVLATNAAPLGLELGVATQAQVRQQLNSQTQLEEAGTNQYSGGNMLKGDGEGLGIDGLSEIVFIFDTGDKLAAVLMTLPKGEGFGDLQAGNFTKTAKALGAKYKLVEKIQPFVGNARAIFRQGDSVVELDAPHMSFTMTLRYLTQALEKTFKQQSTSNKAAKERTQANKF